MLGVIGLGYVGFTSLLGLHSIQVRLLDMIYLQNLLKSSNGGTFISKIMRCKTIIKIIIETLT